MKDPETRVFAGIDEAGLGPLLGPLTVGYSAFQVPRGSADLWSVLGKIVSNEPKKDRDRLVVADSKRVFSRNPRGARRLETTVLSFLAQLDPRGIGPCSGHELLGTVAPQLAIPPEVWAAHPWYARLEEGLPREVPPDRLVLRRRQLARELESSGVELVDAGVRVIPAGELNASFVQTCNKSLSHWRLTGGIILYLWNKLADQGLSLFVDRLGGRMRYARLLGELVPEAAVEVVSEASSLSEYRLCGPTKRMRIAFAERCEERSFSVALASCLAKYARELSMKAFNDHFCTLQPGLRPTAGYTTDGRRWLEDAKDAVERSKLRPGVLVRER